MAAVVHHRHQLHEHIAAKDLVSMYPYPTTSVSILDQKPQDLHTRYTTRCRPSMSCSLGRRLQSFLFSRQIIFSCNQLLRPSNRQKLSKIVVERKRAFAGGYCRKSRCTANDLLTRYIQNSTRFDARGYAVGNTSNRKPRRPPGPQHHENLTIILFLLELHGPRSRSSPANQFSTPEAPIRCSSPL
jgi:hypothetical protein